MVWSDCGSSTELVDVSADPPRTVVDDRQVQSSAVGPDGRLAYVRNRAGASQIVLRDPDGTDRELMSRPGARITNLAFSPDGRSIAFVLGDVNEPGIYLASTDESRPANRLTEDPSDVRPVFVGDELIFTRHGADRAPRLMRMGVDGTGARLASRRPRRTIGADGVGRRVLLAAPDRPRLYWWDPRTGRESSGPAVGQVEADDVRLSPDGRWLLYLAGGNGREVWRLRLDGRSQPERVHGFADDVSSSNGAIDASGRATVVVHRWVGDLWIVRPTDDARW